MGNNIFRSAYKNKTEKVLRLLDENPDLISAKGKADLGTLNKEACCIGQTLLFIAAAHGNTQLVQELLQRGANINEFNECNDDTMKDNQWTAIMMACAMGNRDTFVLLIESGADLTIKDSLQKNALDILSARYPQHVGIFMATSKKYKMENNKPLTLASSSFDGAQV